MEGGPTRVDFSLLELKPTDEGDRGPREVRIAASGRAGLAHPPWARSMARPSGSLDSVLAGIAPVLSGG